MVRTILSLGLALGLVAITPLVAVESRAQAGDPPPTAAAPVPDASVPEATATLAREVSEQLAGGEHGAAVDRLDPDACTALAAAPTAAYGVAAVVMRTYLVVLKKDPAIATALVERLGSLATADDPSPHATGVRTLRDLLRSLTGKLRDQSAPPGDVKAALAALRKLEAKLPPLDPTFVAAFEIAKFVASARSTDADAWGALLATADPLRKANAADDAFAYAVATAELQLGQLVAASDAATARPMLERALTAFAAKGWAAKKQRNGTWPVDAGLFNRALTAAKNLGVAAKLEYVSDTFWSRGRALSAKVPALMGWTWTYGDSDQDYGKLVRSRTAGGDVELQIWGYNGWTEYTTSDGSAIPGENVDGFLKKGMKGDRESLTKIARDTRTAGAMSATIKDTKGYELKGVDYEGVPTRYRNWFFKYSLALKRYFNVALTQTGTYSEKDPEVLFLVESIEEHSER